MFGVDLRPQEERYDFTEEWVTILKQVWSEDEPFDFKGKYFDLEGVLLKPKPWGDDRPMLVSAGNSPAGKAFAARHADCLFTSIMEFEGFRRQRAGASRAAIRGRECRCLCQRAHGDQTNHQGSRGILPLPGL